ncbi:MAG: four helix bundle protein [Armatimonadetes bacterium]|nr:four helix bundle protein [Armatimonadota bacterium]
MIYFDHQKLNVYQEAVRFVAWADELIQSIQRGVAAKDQLDRASTSVPLNIAEGNGRFSVKDRCRFLSNAYGSAVECAACLDVLVAKKLATPEDIEPGKRTLKDIVSMLVGLMNSLSNRVAEDGAEYTVAGDFEVE